MEINGSNRNQERSVDKNRQTDEGQVLRHSRVKSWEFLNFFVVPAVPGPMLEAKNSPQPKVSLSELKAPNKLNLAAIRDAIVGFLVEGTIFEKRWKNRNKPVVTGAPLGEDQAPRCARVKSWDFLNCLVVPGVPGPRPTKADTESK